MEYADPAERFYAHVWPQAAMVLRAARLLTREDASAEDLVQETLLKAFRAIDLLHDPSGVIPWLMTILRNTHIDQLRARASAAGQVLSLDAMELDVPFEPQPAQPEQGDIAAILEELSDRTLVDALAALPEAIRFTLLLVDIQQMDHADVAAVLEIPVGTVKSRVHRGHAMLRDLLSAGKSAGPSQAPSTRHRASSAGEP